MSILGGKLEGKRQLLTPRLGTEGNIKKEHGGIGNEGGIWI
jgi:hypothetical protein